MDYGMTVRTTLPFAEAAARVRGALREQGFGVLPCNVVIRGDAGQTVVEALDPQTMVTVTGEPALMPVAEEAASRLRAALASLPAAD